MCTFSATHLAFARQTNRLFCGKQSKWLEQLNQLEGLKQGGIMCALSPPVHALPRRPTVYWSVEGEETMVQGSNDM